MEINELAFELRNMLLRLTHINDCFLLHQKLLDYTRINNREMNIAPAFFQIIMYSLEHTYIIDIYKLYDQAKTSEGLRRAINLCEQHSTLFPEERVMLMDEETGIKDIVKINIIKDIKIIRKKLDSLEPIINSLKGRRDKYYAHYDRYYVDDLPKVSEKYPLSKNQVSELIATAHEILNILLRDLKGEVVAMSSANYDDMDVLFKILNAYIRKKEELYKNK